MTQKRAASRKPYTTRQFGAQNNAVNTLRVILIATGCARLRKQDLTVKCADLHENHDFFEIEIFA